jgi:hypothetical protein
MNPRGAAFLSGILLAASAAYLIALLFGYVFDIGNVRRHHVESASYVFAVAALAVSFARAEPNISEPPHPNTHRGWLTAAFMAAAALLYGNTFNLGLFSDDFVLADRALDGDWIRPAGFLRPLPLAIWNLTLAGTGSPAALHVLNVGLHGLNAALVCGLATRLGLPRSSAVAAGALFVAFPASVEAVVWPAAVHDLLVAACGLGFVLLAAQRLTPLRTVAATSLLVLALLSKESAIIIPVLGAVLWLRLDSPRRTAGWPLILIGIAVCMIYVGVRLSAGVILESYAREPSRYLVKELIARPIGTLTLPWNSAMLAAWPAVPFVWAAACVAGAALYSWRTTKAIPPSTIVRCVLAALVGVLPVYSMLFITPDLENGRYLYLSTAFWVTAIIGIFSTSEGLTRARLFGVAATLIAGIAGVQVHLRPWREAAGLRERVLAAAEDVWRTAKCRSVSLAGAPDSVHGAYVFRNGLSEAVAFRTGAVPAAGSGGCTFVWDGTAFRRADTVSVPVQASFSR